MANAFSPSKAKSSSGAAPTRVARHKVSEEPVGNAQAASKRRGRITLATKAGAVAQLRAGSELLTKAASDFVRTTPAGGTQQGVGDFRQAYASIVKSFPKPYRLALLQSMRQSIDDVVEEEQQGASAPAAAERNKRVSTADFMAQFEQQEQTQRAQDVKSERLVSGAEMRQRLQVSAQALSAALKKKRIFALVGPSGDYVYPAFFADLTLDRRILERVCQVLGDLPGASKWDFFTNPRISLGGKSPLQALAKGKVDAVMDAAHAFKEE